MKGDRFGRHGKPFTEEQRITMARMRAQGCAPSDIADRIGETRLRVRDWLDRRPDRVADAEQQLDRELKAAEEAAHPSVKPDSFIRPPTMAQLMAGR